ncbi:hypothetical protein C8R44DRAFT_728280 [Mycena epipterygia]|nr:hypothetical protein C8R44DRAFT_728280 [Mycena epipterygia]
MVLRITDSWDAIWRSGIETNCHINLPLMSSREWEGPQEHPARVEMAMPRKLLHSRGEPVDIARGELAHLEKPGVKVEGKMVVSRDLSQILAVVALELAGISAAVEEYNNVLNAPQMLDSQNNGEFIPEVKVAPRHGAVDVHFELSAALMMCLTINIVVKSNLNLEG